MVSSRNADALAYSLWSLLPSFCNYPLDTAECFVQLQGHLCKKIKEEPDIRGIICTSLQLLIQQNKNVVDTTDKDYTGQDMAEEQGSVCYSQQVAADNLNVLKSSAKNMLDALSDVFLKPTKDDGGCLQVLNLGNWELLLQCLVVVQNLCLPKLRLYSDIKENLEFDIGKHILDIVIFHCLLYP